MSLIVNCKARDGFWAQAAVSCRLKLLSRTRSETFTADSIDGKGNATSMI